ncbi:peptide chain release factor N(5)-glutamine methyltransferase [Campylobacter molothri]|uniref:Peptide chain release factor N(5)-glutamine methyltransferase n=1 Tax=Campylobacter molothri TaxID=1032242 RepID=A0ACC5W338_9BACT|nr:peptide chain release factor N(5)-glutamine methyltransferase [Campylobacter sp. RM10542]MBZ7958876.1 peptide chain release factor N(5)-glutamine methyltransferase [Campylobacter sp. RM9760]MBZ7975075.1 peptide chain release factor N(5)-glutamine methyltransferase [Campylobacter sp. RM9754]
MTIKEALNQAKSKLKGYENEATFILCEYLNKDKTWLFLNQDLNFDPKIYFQLIDRFNKGEPFEYIFEKVNFWGLDFKINKGVLIPRYDTEILLNQILNLCKTHQFKNILEIGFGSGILSIILAKELKINLTACDINPKALELAKKNAKIHGVEKQIDFKLCDFSTLKDNYDFIFSNPPYIKNSYPIDIWVQSEPKEALFGGEKGYEILEKIIQFAYSKKVKFIACEFGYDQKKVLNKILKKYHFSNLFFKDEAGYDRVFVAKFTQN